MIPHQSAVLIAALEAAAGQKLLVRRTPMRHILAFAVDAVDEQLDGAHMVARQQHARRLLDAVLDQRQRHYGAALLRQRAARLLFAVVRIEIDVTARLRHPVAGYFEQEEVAAVRVYDVHELGVARVQANGRSHALEVRLRRIQAGDASETGDAFASVAGSVRAQRVANQVHVVGFQAVVVAEFGDQIGDLKADHTCVSGSLHTAKRKNT